MRKLQRELLREFPDARLEPTKGGHLRLIFPDGGSVIVATSPSSRNFMHAVRRDVKRCRNKEQRP